MIEIYVKYLLILTHTILFISGLKNGLSSLFCDVFFFYHNLQCLMHYIYIWVFLDPLSQYVYYAYLDLNCHKQSLVLADKNLLFHFEVYRLNTKGKLS